MKTKMNEIEIVDRGDEDAKKVAEQVQGPRYGFTIATLYDDGRLKREEILELNAKLKALIVPPLTDEQKALFLLSCDHDVDFAIVTINEFFKARQGAPELFDDRQLERNELTYQLNVIRYSIFPQRTADGCAIMYHSLADTTVSHYQMEHSMKLLFMTLDSAVYDDPPTGLVILFDMRGVGLMHLTRVKMGAIRKFAHYLQEGLTLKLKQIHVLNTQYFIDKIMIILKPFIKKEIYSMLHFHPAMEDMTSFHETWLPKCCMPADYQGDLPSIDDLHEANTVRLHELRAHFDAEQKQRHDFYGKAQC